MIVTLLLILSCASSSATLAQMLGMAHLLQGLALRVQSKNQFNEVSTAYMIDPKVNLFISQFRTRTQLCDYKCQNFFNFPCFVLFGCNVHLKNFFFAIIIPFIMIVLLGACCGKKMWSLECWLKYGKIFLAINFFKWVISKCQESEGIRRRKEKEKQEEELIKGRNGETKQVDIEFNEVLSMKREREKEKEVQKKSDKRREEQTDREQDC